MLWDKNRFCGIETFVAPKNMFWTPDISIMERYTKLLLPETFIYVEK